MEESKKIIRPQHGPQEQFLTSSADIVIYGGAAGGGKTWSLLIEPLRHVKNKDFGAVIFRRTTKQVLSEGGLWDASANIYPYCGAKSRDLEWRFPSGAKISFAHLEYEKNALDWQGSEIPLLMFDEVTHFTPKQFWYLLSRNRSTSGIRPYVRATCNPDPDSFIADLIGWWINDATGYAIPERSGVIRYFVRVNDVLHWADDPNELKKDFPESGEPKSFSFIQSSLEDNKVLMRADPGYLANLNALPTIERERLKKGNWKIRDESASIIKAKWWQMWPKDTPFPLCIHEFASYDTAFTEKDRDKDDTSKSSHSARTTWGIFEDPITKLHHMMLLGAWNGQVGFPKLRKDAKEHHIQKKLNCSLIEKKASGASLLQELRRANIAVRGFEPGRYGDKEQRAHLASTLFQAGMVWYPDRKWAKKVINWVAAFPQGDPPSADYADTVSQAAMYVKKRMWLETPEERHAESPDEPVLDPDDWRNPPEEPRRGYG